MFLSCPHCSRLSTVISPQPWVHREGLKIQWAHKTGHLEFTHRSSTSKDSCLCAPMKNRSKYGWVSKREKKNDPSMINRKKLTVLCVICSLSPSKVPWIAHTRELHSTATSKQRREPSPSIWELWANLSFRMQIFPQTKICQDLFLGRLCSLQTNMQMVDAQVDHKANKKTLTVPIFPASPFRLKSQFLGNFRDILLLVRVSSCWNGESVAICTLSAFSIFPSSRCVCVFLFMVASQAILGLKSICQHVSSFLSDERSIHLWLWDGTQTPTEPYPQPPEC